MIWAILSLVLLPPGKECQTAIDSARAAYQAKDYKASAAAFDRAAAACPESKSLLLDIAQAQVLAQRLPDAQRTLARLLALDPKNTIAMRLKADAHYLAGEDKAAEELLKKAIGIEPRNTEAIYSLGRMYYQQSRYEDAARQFKLVLELDPKSYKAHDNLALAYEGLNDNQQAIQHYLKALDLVYKDHPEYDWPYGNFANLMLKMGDYQKAFELAVEGAKRNPASARNCFLTGKALTKLGKDDLSLRWLERAVTLDPEYTEPRYLLGQIYRKLGREADAAREFKAFQEITARTPRVKR